MSLKRYLFLLIAMLVVGLAAVQLLLMNYFQQQLNDEISDKSTELSRHMIDWVVKDVVKQPLLQSKNGTPDKVFISIQSDSQRVELNTELIGNSLSEPLTHIKKTEPVADNKEPVAQANDAQIENQPTIKENHADVVLFSKNGTVPEVLRKKLHRDLSLIKIEKLHNQQGFVIAKEQNQEVNKQILTFSPADSAVKQYFDLMLWVLVAATLISLLLAYWLSHHISRPLSGLSQGFKKLEQGELGSQIKSEGVDEIKQTLISFNQMSEQLKQLAEKEQNYQQQQQLAELGEISRGLAHTLRNPINTIGLSLEQIAQPQLDDEQRQGIAHQARQKINVINNTIKALLSLTEGNFDRQQQVNVCDVIRDILLEISITRSHPITFEPSIEPKLMAAESEIRALLHTLIVNAVEASTEQQAVAVFIAENHGQVTVKVVDQGKGISPEVQSKLFQPHVTTKPEGAGMGLYIARRIARLHYNGDVSLINNESNGCIASLKLTSATIKTNK